MHNVINKLKNKIAPWYKNLQGWRTDRKIMVIESDDWGSIRMPSKQVYENCLKNGYRVDLNPFEKYDSLASEDDLEHLFQLLCSFKDKNGNHPIITANAMVANPDFEKIEEFRFHEYYFECINKTFESYPRHQNCLNLWRQGMSEGVFFPQSHGREHLNVSMFMNALRNQKEDVIFGFKRKMPGSVPKCVQGGRNDYVIALKYHNKRDKKNKKDIFSEGLSMFEDLFGYRSKSFTPPNYWWSPDFNKVAYNNGVQYFQGNRVMLEPAKNGESIPHKFKLGQHNHFGQIYLVRNVTFEPSIFRLNINDPVESCLREIDIAFKMGKPAVICSHRINYVGFIQESNRDANLRRLKKLLEVVCKKWPEIEFMNSVDLGNIIRSCSLHN